MEEPIHDAQMKVEVGIEAGAVTMENADGPERGVRWCGGAGLPQGSVEGPEQDVKAGAAGAGPVTEEGPETFGHGEDPLADGHVGKDVVHQVGCGLGHALGIAGGAGASAFAGKRHQEVVAAARAPGPGEAVGQDAALQVAPKLSFHMIRYAVAHGVGLVGQG